MDRAVVTGASGFVGSVLARRLLADGHEVHLLLRPGWQNWRISEIAREVSIHEVDLRDGAEVNRVIRSVRPNAVFHLAAHGAYSAQTDPAAIVGANILSCINLLDACAAIDVESFVHTGSSSEYGYKDHAPSEDEALEPNSSYAVTKAAATHYCRFMAKTHDLHAVTLRLYSVYGPFEEPSRFIPTVIIRGLQNELPPLVSPTTARDFVYVDDAVEAIVRVASNVHLPRGSVYNVCSGVQTAIGEVVQLARETLGITAEPEWSSMPGRRWDTNVWFGNPNRMAREVGWSATTTLDRGFRETVQWLSACSDRLDFYRSCGPKRD